jgi:transcriptional regulator with XRE-family HTH domain
MEALNTQKTVLIFVDDAPIGHALRVKRTADGFSQAQLARILGMSVGVLCEIERLVRQVPFRKMEVISNYLYHQWYENGELVDRIEY